MTPPGRLKRASEVGQWSSDKLALLRRYLHGESGRGGYLRATTGADRRYYIDLFAGPGQNIITASGQVIDGSPLIAVKAGPPEFTRLFWVDADAKNVESLKEHRQDYPSRRIEVLAGDANELVTDILKVVPKAFPVFAFLDPRGAELRWRTIEKLARHKAESQNKVELFILFAYNQGIVRFMPHDETKMVNAAALDRVMPDRDGWRHIYRRRLNGEADAWQTRREMLDEYRRGLASLGYRFIPDPRLIFTPSGRPLYFLVFASDHPVGNRIMDWCLRNTQDSRRQLSFLPYNELY